MAFEKLGIQFIARGASQFARSIYDVNASLHWYNIAVDKATKKSNVGFSNTIGQLNRAISGTKVAISKSISAMVAYRTQWEYLNSGMKSAANAIGRSVLKAIPASEVKKNKDSVTDSLKSLMSSYTKIFSKLPADKADKLFSMYEDIYKVSSKTGKAGFSKKIISEARKISTEGTKELKKFAVELRALMMLFDGFKTGAGKDAVKGFVTDLDKVGKKIKEIRNLQKQYANESKNKIEFEKTLESLLNELVSVETEMDKASEKLQSFKGIKGSIRAIFSKDEGLGSIFDPTSVKGQGLGVIMNVISTGLRGITAVAQPVVAVIGGVVEVFSNLAKGAVNVGVSIVKNVVSGFLKLAAIPFNFLINSLSGIATFFQRIIEVTLGMGLDRTLWAIGIALRNVAKDAFDAAIEFQMLEIRLEGLMARELRDTGVVKTFNEGLERSGELAKDLFDWVSRLAVTTPFNVDTINNAVTLAMSYNLTSKEAKKLTESIVNFATGMGLSDEHITRIIENLGQMRQQGKITGTEMRDLARGAFVPVGDILEVLGKTFGMSADLMNEELPQILDLISERSGIALDDVRTMAKEGSISVEEFFKAFEIVVGRDFPEATGRSSKTIQTFISNLGDFTKSVLGMRIIKPVLDAVSNKLSDFIPLLGNEKIYKAADALGSALKQISSFTLDAFGLLGDDIESDVESFSNALLNLSKGIDSVFNPDKYKTLPNWLFSGKYFEEGKKWGQKFRREVEFLKETLMKDPLGYLRNFALPAVFNTAEFSITRAIDGLFTMIEGFTGRSEFTTAFNDLINNVVKLGNLNLKTLIHGFSEDNAGKGAGERRDVIGETSIINDIKKNVDTIVEEAKKYLGEKLIEIKDNVIAFAEDVNANLKENGVSPLLTDLFGGIINFVKNFDSKKFAQDMNALAEGVSKIGEAGAKWLTGLTGIFLLGKGIVSIAVGIAKLTPLWQGFVSFIAIFEEKQKTGISDFIYEFGKAIDYLGTAINRFADSLSDRNFQNVKDFINMLLGASIGGGGKLTGIQSYAEFLSGQSEQNGKGAGVKSLMPIDDSEEGLSGFLEYGKKIATSIFSGVSEAFTQQNFTERLDTIFRVSLFETSKENFKLSGIALMSKFGEGIFQKMEELLVLIKSKNWGAAIKEAIGTITVDIVANVSLNFDGSGASNGSYKPSPSSYNNNPNKGKENKYGTASAVTTATMARASFVTNNTMQIYGNINNTLDTDVSLFSVMSMQFSD